MQPYIFPYIGYFQLINAVDKFVFYDDVHFIKKGWINKNNILVNSEASSFTIPLKKVSQNKLINETEVNMDEKWLKQFYDTIYFNYKKAPNYEKVNGLIRQTMEQLKTNNLISNLAQTSVMLVSDYLGIKTEFEFSSQKYPQTRGMEKAARLKCICTLNNSDEYINPSGGMELYSKSDFLSDGIHLKFIQSCDVRYKQFNEKFVSSLSIIDVLMFNDISDIRKMLEHYKLS